MRHRNSRVLTANATEFQNEANIRFTGSDGKVCHIIDDELSAQGVGDIFATQKILDRGRRLEFVGVDWTVFACAGIGRLNGCIGFID